MCPFIHFHAQTTPLGSATVGTGELWSKTNLHKWQTFRAQFFYIIFFKIFLYYFEFSLLLFFNIFIQFIVFDLFLYKCFFIIVVFGTTMVAAECLEGRKSSKVFFFILPKGPKEPRSLPSAGARSWRA